MFDKKDKRHPLSNPAALSAFVRGDYENFVAAASPGGIEAQEKAGQSTLTHADRLPKKDLPQRELEALGFTFGNDIDTLFVSCTFPEGWQVRSDDHAMWSGLYDPQGRRRMAIFYKAAFYDRDAFCNTERRYTATNYHRDSPAGAWYTAVVDNATKSVLYRATAVQGPDEKDWTFRERAAQEATAWLAAHYPDYTNAFAYWD